ncbi:hypothetical protein L484_027890 [Morus notabilis]|uniref:Uncharacterized protein n=1 Tax=Morus notabilis TaxID=981085 RepID=W9S7D0_9ROSA|nr:hypothetical protein L484_027890 [Morus notabilis]
MEPFEKTLTKTDVEHKLIVKNGWLGHLLPYPIPGSDAIPIPFKDDFGKDYTFGLRARSPKHGETYYTKPECMFKEWHGSLLRRSLRQGRKFTFGGISKANVQN